MADEKGLYATQTARAISRRSAISIWMRARGRLPPGLPLKNHEPSAQHSQRVPKKAQNAIRRQKEFEKWKPTLGRIEACSIDLAERGSIWGISVASGIYTHCARVESLCLNIRLYEGLWIYACVIRAAPTIWIRISLNTVAKCGTSRVR